MTADLIERLRSMEVESGTWLFTNVNRYMEIAEEMMKLAAGGSPPAQALALRVYGNSLMGQGRTLEALRALHKSLKLWKRAGAELDWARTQIPMLYVLGQLGKHRQAMQASQVAYEIFKRHEQPLLAARLMNNTAFVYWTAGRPLNALQCFTMGEELAVQASDEGLRARFSHHRALILQQLGRYRESLSACAGALRYGLRRGQRVFAGRVQLAGAITLFRLGRFGKALRRFARARAIFVSESVPRDVAECDLYICACYVELNRYEEVLARAKSVLELVEQTKSGFQYACAQLYQGVALARLGRAEGAHLSLRTANRWFQKHGHNTWGGQATLDEAALYLTQGVIAQAIQCCKRAQRLFAVAGMPVEQGRALLLEAEAYLQARQVGLAEAAADRALKIFKKARLPIPTFRSLHLLGRIALERRQWEAARRLLSQAVDTAEKTRVTVQVAFRKGFLDDKASAYADLVWLHLRQGRVGAAYRLADRAKSRQLVDVLSGLTPRPSAFTDARDHRVLAEIEELRREHQQLTNPFQFIPEESASISRETGSRSARRAEVEQRLAALWDEWELRQTANSVGGRGFAAATDRLHARLPEGGCIVEYFAASKRLVAFVVDRRGLRGHVELGSIEPVRRGLELLQLNLDAALVAPSGAAVPPGLTRNAKALLGDLYRRLWEPLLPLVRGKRTAVIVPHGLLHLVPFEALHDGSQYLAQDVEISLAPSREIWAHCLQRASRTGKGPPLVMGCNPEDALPFVDEEVRWVAEALGVKGHLSSAASSNRLKSAGESRLIHLAVHGEFRADNPNFSTLLLGDGPFTVAEASALRLNASLVVLSGCETGLSRITTGEELVGLISAFLRAGCASVLASRWRVDDSRTAELMRRVYNGLLSGKGKAAALREAQAAMADQEVHPLFWAAFGVVGDHGPMNHGNDGGVSE